MSKYLAEIIPTQIINYVASKIDAAIAAESSAFPDGVVPLNQPETYYDYEEASPPQCPAFYILEDRIDYRLAQQGANHINALGTFRCGMIVEDFEARNLVHATRRYANILHQILNGAIIDYTVSGTVVARDVVKISATAFSEAFRKNAEASAEANPYRKEFVHELQIEHYETFS